MEVESVVEVAPAKLNLDLYVEARRADGYHLLDSVTAFTAFGDTLEVRTTDGPSDRIALAGPMAAVLEREGESLVSRAFDGLRRLTSTSRHFDVRLTKRIPLAAGLGGGSADAGAALRAGARLLALDPANPRLAALALELGADVPICLQATPARLRGIGEHLEPAPPLPDPALVLVNPGVATPTAAVFRRLDPARFAPPPPRAADAGGWPAWFLDGRNDLEEAAVQVAPPIARVIERLRASSARVVRLCGSGATVFAAYETDGEAEAAATAIGTEEPGWWLTRTRLRR